MGFIQTSAAIKVDMIVTRFRAFPEDGMMEIWGHVGDYEVCIHVPHDDAGARELLERNRVSTGRGKKTKKSG